MAKKNWSKSEPSMRKPHAAKYAAKPGVRLGPDTSAIFTAIDWELVQLAFASKSDPNRGQMYQPPIVGKTICR